MTDTNSCIYPPLLTDTVYELLRKPFCRLSEEVKRQILDNGRPTPTLGTVVQRASEKNSRKFNPWWYDTHKWLTGSETKAKLYCWPCLLLSSKDGTWNRDGYFDMKNLSKAIQKHEMSKDHISNAVNLKRLEKSLDTISELRAEQHKLSTQLHNMKVNKNRQIFRRLVDATVLFCKQNLPFRELDENESLNRGNFIENLTRLLCNDDDDLREHWEEMERTFTGFSKSIQNELIECVYEEVMYKITEEIKKAPFFSIQCDDATDITEISQLSIIIRCVDVSGVLQERFLGYRDINVKRTASNLCHFLLEFLKDFNIKNKLIGQCYDGASVMTDEIEDLRTLMRSHAPQALFTHCCAHPLNHVLQNGAKCIKDVRIFFSNVEAFPTYFQKSPKRTSVLDDVIGCAAHDVRWSSNAKIVGFIASERERLLIVFQNIEEDSMSSSESLIGAQRLKILLYDFKFLFLLNVYRDIFVMTDVLCDTLQKKSLDIQYCFSAIEEQIRKLDELRSERKAEEYFIKANIYAPFSNDCKDDLKINPAQYQQLYFEIVDNILLQLRCRFRDIQNLEFLQLVDSSKFKEFNKTFPVSALTSLNRQFATYFDFSRLRNELEFVYCDDQFISRSVSDNIVKFVVSDIHNILPEVYKLFCLAGTIPATSCNIKKSCLKRMRSHFRSTIGENRHIALDTLSIERRFLDQLEKQDHWHDDVIRRYAKRDQRIDLLYK